MEDLTREVFRGALESFYGRMAENGDIAGVKLAEDKWTLKEMGKHLETAHGRTAVLSWLDRWL